MLFRIDRLPVLEIASSWRKQLLRKTDHSRRSLIIPESDVDGMVPLDKTGCASIMPACNKYRSFLMDPNKGFWTLDANIVGGVSRMHGLCPLRVKVYVHPERRAATSGRMKEDASRPPRTNRAISAATSQLSELSSIAALRSLHLSSSSPSRRTVSYVYQCVYPSAMLINFQRFQGCRRLVAQFLRLLLTGYDSSWI